MVAVAAVAVADIVALADIVADIVAIVADN